MPFSKFVILLLGVVLLDVLKKSDTAGVNVSKDLKHDLQIVKTSEIPANFSKRYNDFVIEGMELSYEYMYVRPPLDNKTLAIRITAFVNESQDIDESHPLLFVVRRQQSILSWTLPMHLQLNEYVNSYYKVSRILCPQNSLQNKIFDSNQTLYVDVSTSASQNLSFYLEAEKVNDFHLRTDDKRKVEITPSEPVYLMYTFPEDVESVIVQGHSEDTLCMTLSIQKIQCPVFDLNRDVEFTGRYQTMTTQAAMTLLKDEYMDSENSFFVVMVLKPGEFDCEGTEKINPSNFVRKKNLTITITKTIPATKYYIAVIAASAVFVGFYVVAILIGVVYHTRSKNWGVWQLPNPADNEAEPLSTSTSTSSGRNQGYGAVSGDASPPKRMRKVRRTRRKADDGEDDDDDDEADFEKDMDFVPDANVDKSVLRLKKNLMVSDLAQKSFKRQHKNLRTYCRNIFTIAIFYGLPVLQLVLTYQTVFNNTGNQDLCYYNFSCSRPFKNLGSFNNVFSNIGYMLLGLLFIIIVWRRDIVYKKAIAVNPDIEQLYGIPQHNGLFYAMGLALCMEGIMSACYHVCPNYSNFQFDTSFMYMMACLCILRIYQSRHPDILAKAHTSYLVMALVIFIAVIGVVYGSKDQKFWIAFACIDVLATFILSIHIYYMGELKLDRSIFTNIYRTIRYEFKYCVNPTYKGRFFILLIGVLINWGWVIYGAVNRPSDDFATFLLSIFIINLFLYMVFYIIMKLQNKEKIQPLPAFCILCAIITWAMALFFFFQNLTSWLLTPSVSRSHNKECWLLNFYDAHDIWHFLSAMGLFFSFLVLLTLDDDLFSRKRDTIPVF